jgi:hypothetical protein
VKLENLPKIMTARLHGKTNFGWREEMGIHPLVADVEEAHGLRGLLASYRLFAHLSELVNRERFDQGHAAMNGGEYAGLAQAALVAVFHEAWLGHWSSVGEWAQIQWGPAVATTVMGPLAGGYLLDEYVDWDAVGKDQAQAQDSLYLVLFEDDELPVWVFVKEKVDFALDTVQEQEDADG